MRNGMPIKAAALLASATILLLVATTKAQAANIESNVGMAGISRSFPNYEEGRDEEKVNLFTKILMTEIVSPYANLGISTASNYVNIRSEANTEGEVLGKLYKGCSADILERDGDWVKIESGNVKGYIMADYLAIGKDAEVMIEQYATKWATVTTETLFVRAGQGTDTECVTMVPFDATYYVVKEYDEWVEILLGTDDETNEDFTGFVSKKYVDIKVEFEYAISIEEENAKIKAEQEAIRAEEERLVKLAAQEAAEKAEKIRIAEAAVKKAKSNSSSNNSSSNNSSSNSNSSSNNNSSSASSNSTNGDLSALRNEITTYALKFVGNPYVWGGVSLTNGADCSGFVQTIYRNFGYSIPRVSSSQAGSAGIKVSVSDIKPGDLLFYTNNSGHVNHVAMYIGNGMIVHASNRREGIKTSKYNYRTIYCARRIVY